MKYASQPGTRPREECNAVGSHEGAGFDAWTEANNPVNQLKERDKPDLCETCHYHYRRDLAGCAARWNRLRCRGLW